MEIKVIYDSGEKCDWKVLQTLYSPNVKTHKTSRDKPDVILTYLHTC